MFTYFRRRFFAKRLAFIIVLQIVFTVHFYKKLLIKPSAAIKHPNHCYGSTAQDRICRLQNLCFDPAADRWHLYGPDAHNFTFEGSNFLDKSSVSDHNTYFWHWRAKSDLPNDRSIGWIMESVHLVKRFYPVNIMHLFHDDAFGMYDVANRLYPDVKKFLFIDEYGPGPYDEVYNWIGSWLQLAKVWPVEKRGNGLLCFKDAIVGNSKRNVWYQYGFHQPQSIFSGHKVTMATLTEPINYFREKSGAKITKRFYSDRKEFFLSKKWPQGRQTEMVISVFTRKKTRLMLNEQEMHEALQSHYNLPVISVSLEDMNLPEIVSIMSKTVIAIGMHGSLLVMAAFMPPGSILMEMFPYAVPPSDYQPYAELCRILGHHYLTWSSPHAHFPKTIGHVGRGKMEGGMRHLNETERLEILKDRWIKPHKCCYNAAWLYRIFQDTWVEVEEVMSTIDNHLNMGFSGRYFPFGKR